MAFILEIKNKIEAFTQLIDKVILWYHIISLYNKKLKTQASIIYQLKTWITYLNDYLLKMNLIDLEICLCKIKIKTVYLFLICCLL